MGNRDRKLQLVGELLPRTVFLTNPPRRSRYSRPDVGQALVSAWKSVPSSSRRRVPGPGLPMRQSAGDSVRPEQAPSLYISCVQLALAQPIILRRYAKESVTENPSVSQRPVTFRTQYPALTRLFLDRALARWHPDRSCFVGGLTVFTPCRALPPANGCGRGHAMLPL